MNTKYIPTTNFTKNNVSINFYVKAKALKLLEQNSPYRYFLTCYKLSILDIRCYYKHCCSKTTLCIV